MKIKAKDFEYDVVDYFISKRNTVSLDLKIKTKSEMENFLNIYKSHGYDDGVFDYELDGIKHIGHFGTLKYDSNYNIRLCIANSASKEDYLNSYEASYSTNIGDAIEQMNKNMISICEIICSSKTFNYDEEKMSKIIKTSEFYSNKLNLQCYVENLDDYLRETKELLSDLRAEEQ